MDQLLTNLMLPGNQDWAIYSIGLGMGVFAFLVCRGVLIRPARTDPDSPPEELKVQVSQDRRTAPRRRDNPVMVELSDPSGQIEPCSAWVTDRSQGGLGLIVKFAVPVGTVLKVRPRSKEDLFWIPVEVRSCQETEDGYAIGCKFGRTPPWNVMMLFG